MAHLPAIVKMSKAIRGASGNGHLRDIPDDELAEYALITSAYAADFRHEAARRGLDVSIVERLGIPLG